MARSTTQRLALGEFFIIFVVALLLGIGLPTLANKWKEPEKGAIYINPALGIKGEGKIPVSLEIPKLKKTFNIEKIDLTGPHALVPPDDTETLGWWEKSARPGMLQGQTVYTGHSIHSGKPTVGLNNINLLSLDDTIVVKTKDKSFTYKVYRQEKIGKNDLAQKQIEFFSQVDSTRGRLVLITCADWNGTIHETNYFVFANLVKIKKLKK